MAAAVDCIAAAVREPHGAGLPTTGYVSMGLR